MESLLTYLWQSAVVLTMLFIPFQLLLRKEQYFALNRAILLGILLLSLALPLSHHTMPMFVDNWLHPQADMEAAVFSPLGEYQDWDGFIIIEEGDVEDPSSIEIHWTDFLIALWLLGSVIFLLRQARGIYRLYWILHDKDNAREKLADGNTLLLTSLSLSSFSWMHSIVISQEDYAENGNTILTHECAHISHHHSFDRLLLLLAQTLQWWNPFVWLLADSLSQVHEYQADLAVLNQGINATQYQLLLIRKAAGPAGLALVNGFKRNKLKLRIVMMNNMIKLRGAKCRYLTLLPVFLMAFALTAKAQEKTTQVIEPEEEVFVEYPGDFEIITNDNTQDPLVLVEGELYEDWKNIDPSIIKSMTVYRADGDTVAHYSAIYDAARYGVIKIELQDDKKQKPYKKRTVSSEEANEHAIQYVADVKAGRIKPRDNGSFMVQDVDIAPEFPNGGSFKNYINRNLRYPISAAEKGVQGMVIVEFHIMKDGRIAHVKSFSNETNVKELEEEAIRVVSSMPNWTPGKINDQNVNTSMYVPITFKLNSTPVKHTIGDMPYTEDMLFVYDGNVVNLSDIKDLVPEECGINGMSLHHEGYYVDQYIDKYPKAKNGVVMIDSFMKNSSLFVIDGEPMNFQTMRQKYPEGLPPTKYHINHKDAETIAKYSQYPESKNGVNIIITDKDNS